jgi:hypothetical protein
VVRISLFDMHNRFEVCIQWNPCPQMIDQILISCPNLEITLFKLQRYYSCKASKQILSLHCIPLSFTNLVLLTFCNKRRLHHRPWQNALFIYQLSLKADQSAHNLLCFVFGVWQKIFSYKKLTSKWTTNTITFQPSLPVFEKDRQNTEKCEDDQQRDRLEGQCLGCRRKLLQGGAGLN